MDSFPSHRSLPLFNLQNGGVVDVALGADVHQGKGFFLADLRKSAGEGGFHDTGTGAWRCTLRQGFFR
jgi:hypothetical protein